MVYLSTLSHALKFTPKNRYCSHCGKNQCLDQREIDMMRLFNKIVQNYKVFLGFRFNLDKNVK